MRNVAIAVALSCASVQAAKFGGESTSLTGQNIGKSSHTRTPRRARGSDDGDGAYPKTIDLGNLRPEGIAVGPKNKLLVSQIVYGGISSVDIRTGEVKPFVPMSDFLERGALAVEYTGRGLIVPGGGPVPFGFEQTAVYIYDEHGNDIVTCVPDVGDAGFMNDVTTLDGKAYVTDSNTPNLMVFDVDKAVDDGVCDVSSIALPEEFFGVDFPGANGIAAFGDGLIIGVTSTGAVYFLNLKDTSVTQIVEPGGAPSLNGILVQDDTMYVTQLDNYISVWELVGGNYGEPVTAVEKGKLTSPLFRSAAVSAIVGQYLYTTNLRLDLGLPAPGEEDLSTFDEDFDVVAIKNVFGGHCKD